MSVQDLKERLENVSTGTIKQDKTITLSLENGKVFCKVGNDVTECELLGMSQWLSMLVEQTFLANSEHNRAIFGLQEKTLTAVSQLATGMKELLSLIHIEEQSEEASSKSE